MCVHKVRSPPGREAANSNDLPHLQEKVDYLRGKVNMPQVEEKNTESSLEILNNRIKESINTLSMYLSSRGEKKRRCDPGNSDGPLLSMQGEVVGMK
ncbi:MAG: hypothetical protein WA667_03490 [Candidatus Nitrosopolaris sp.]